MGIQKKSPTILKKTFRHVVRAVALRKAFLSGFTTIPRDAAVASRQAARSRLFCSHSWRIFGTFSMFSYIKEETVSQTFINVLRKFWSQKRCSNWLSSPKPQKYKTTYAPTPTDAPKKRRNVTEDGSCMWGINREPWKCRPAHAWRTVIWSSLWALSRRCKAHGRYGPWRRKSLQWGDATGELELEIIKLKISQRKKEFLFKKVILWTPQCSFLNAVVVQSLCSSAGPYRHPACCFD